MPKKITDITNPGGEIGQYLDLERFIAMVDKLGVIDAAEITQKEIKAAKCKGKSKFIERKIARFATLANQKVHEYLKSREALTRKKDARNSKRKIDFLKEIDETASRFRELVAKAPAAISDNPELEELSGQLEAVPQIVDELRKANSRVELGLSDPYAGEYTDLRYELVASLYALYVDITGREDWVSRIPDTQIYTNEFFHLLRICYQATGEDLSDRTIEDDIKEARRLR